MRARRIVTLLAALAGTASTVVARAASAQATGDATDAPAGPLWAARAHATLFAARLAAGGCGGCAGDAGIVAGGAFGFDLPVHRRILLGIEAARMRPPYSLGARPSPPGLLYARRVTVTLFPPRARRAFVRLGLGDAMFRVDGGYEPGWDAGQEAAADGRALELAIGVERWMSDGSPSLGVAPLLSYTRMQRGRGTFVDDGGRSRTTRLSAEAWLLGLSVIVR